MSSNSIKAVPQYNFLGVFPKRKEPWARGDTGKLDSKGGQTDAIIVASQGVEVHIVSCVHHHHLANRELADRFVRRSRSAWHSTLNM